MEATTKTTVGEGDYENPWTYEGATFTLLLATLTISSVSSTVLLISNRVSNTSDASTLPVVESLEVGNAKLRLRVTGNATTEVLQSLKQTLKSLDTQFLNEK